jgi:hypothetical protein
VAELLVIELTAGNDTDRAQPPSSRSHQGYGWPGRRAQRLTLFDAGHSWLVEVSLAWLVAELLQQRRPRDSPTAIVDFVSKIATRDGLTSVVAPAHDDGGPDGFPTPAVVRGLSEAIWGFVK